MRVRAPDVCSARNAHRQEPTGAHEIKRPENPEVLVTSWTRVHGPRSDQRAQALIRYVGSWTLGVDQCRERFHERSANARPHRLSRERGNLMSMKRECSNQTGRAITATRYIAALATTVAAVAVLATVVLATPGSNVLVATDNGQSVVS